jgi:CHAT domain-containing protein/tetratricopeptide (TPR) repeat protein
LIDVTIKKFFAAVSIISALLIFSGPSASDRNIAALSGGNYSGFDSDGEQPAIISNEFYHYLNLIQNKSINKIKIQSEINSLPSEFEREFLSALLKKREGSYEESYKKLYSLLDDLPSYLNYYEELAVQAKISDNLDELARWLKRNVNKSGSNFYLYLEAMIEIQRGNTSFAIEEFQSLILKGFAAKELYLHLANAQRMSGNYDAAFKNLVEAESLCKPDDYFFPKIINLKGTLNYLSHEFSKAKALYESALKISIANGNTVEEIKAIANLAIIKDQHGDIFDARDDFQRAIKMAEEIENMELLAPLYSELGVSFTYTNDLVDSRKYYENSFSLNEILKNTERLAYLSGNIGSLYLQISNYKSALDYYSRGLKYAGENKLGQIINLTGLGDVYSNESNYTKALNFYNRAKEIADSIKNISSIIKIEQGIGALYFNINRPLDALRILKKADSADLTDDLPFELIKLYSKIGTVLTSVDSLDQAENYFRKSLLLSEKVGDIYSTLQIKTELAHIFFQKQKFDEASELLNEVQAISKQYELTQLLGMQELYFGKIYHAQGRKAASVTKYRNAFELSRSANDFNNQIDAAYLLGLIFEENYESGKAEQWYLKAIDIIENISAPLTLNQEIQIAHFSGLNNVYNSLAELYLKQGKGEEAFLVIDKSRSRNTKVNLNRLKLLSHLKDENEYGKMVDIEWMLNSGLYDKTTTDSLSRILSEVKKDLVSKSEELQEILNPKSSVSIGDLQNKLTADDHVLAVYVGNNFVALFNLSSDEFRYKVLPVSRDSLISMLVKVTPIYRSNLESEEIYINEDLFSFNAQAAFGLYNTIFKEIFYAIPEESNLVVSFPPELVRLPIEMLVTEWDDGESPYFYENKKFLLEEYRVSYTPSVAIYIIQAGDSGFSSNRNLLIGDPLISDAEYSLSVRSGLIEPNPPRPRSVSLFPLKYSGNEIESITRTIDNNLVFTSGEATETNFKQNAPASNVVHISTHSFLLKDQPLILFSSQENDEDDGFLELGEIVQLNLKSELVVLSSCRSGLGRIDAAEGILGMQKAFFDAGSKSVVVSLWDVNDKYTSYFMSSFYKHLADGKTKPEALRSAKLDFMKSHSANPYYWSAFVLSGNPSSLKLQEVSSLIVLYVFLILLLIGLVYFTTQRLIKKYQHRLKFL